MKIGFNDSDTGFIAGSNTLLPKVNEKFKRRLAGKTANRFLIGRILWLNGVFSGLEKLCNADYIGDIGKTTGDTKWYNGVDFTTLPSRVSTTTLPIEATSDFDKIDYWQSKIDNKDSNYRADVVVFYLDSSEKFYSRVAAFKDCFPMSNKYTLSNRTSNNNEITKKNFTLANSGFRFIDPGDSISVGDIELSKANDFYSDLTSLGERYSLSNYFLF